MQKFTITQHDDGRYVLNQEDDKGNVWPPTEKPTARAIIARLSQLLEIGPVAPQTTPEEVCIGEFFTESSGNGEAKP